MPKGACLGDEGGLGGVRYWYLYGVIHRAPPNDVLMVLGVGKGLAVNPATGPGRMDTMTGHAKRAVRVARAPL